MKPYFSIILAFYLFGCSHAEDRSVKISLPRTTYKTYEPINVKFEWINKSSRNDTLFGLFSLLGSFLDIEITDGQGNKVTKHRPDIILTDHGYNVVAPGDTGLYSIGLNEYGLTCGSALEGLYFGQACFFSPGKYKVSVIIARDSRGVNKTPIKTNSIEFEVVEPDEQETEMLKMFKNDLKGMEYLESFKQNLYGRILKQYPNSSYAEHLMYYETLHYLSKYNRSPKGVENPYTDTLTAKYEAFFGKFPNSEYNLNENFVYGYFKVLVSKPDVIQKKELLIDKYPNTLLNYSIRTLVKKNKI